MQRLSQNKELSTFSGLFNLIGTGAYAYISVAFLGQQNNLYDASVNSVNKFNTGIDCSQYGQYIGQFFAELLNAKTPDFVNFDSINST